MPTVNSGVLQQEATEEVSSEESTLKNASRESTTVGFHEQRLHETAQVRVGGLGLRRLRTRPVSHTVRVPR
jgi:hypothetical protein